MTPNQHRAKAEQLLVWTEMRAPGKNGETERKLLQALVHAVLSLPGGGDSNG